ATAKGLELIETHPELRLRLADNVARLRGALASLGLDVEPGPSPVVGLALASTDAMQHVHQRLLDQGIAIAFARDYAGAGPHGTLRIAVFASHTHQQIDRLVDALCQALADRSA